MGALVARHAARCVRSRVAAFAAPVGENQLGIVATHGYPLELVRMIRIVPGAGVIGSVYESGAPMLVEDIRTIGLTRRPRYHTNSFIAVPIRAGAEVVGVVCVADRLDGQPFDRHDLSNLRALTAPTSAQSIKISSRWLEPRGLSPEPARI